MKIILLRTRSKKIQKTDKCLITLLSIALFLIFTIESLPAKAAEQSNKSKASQEATTKTPTITTDHPGSSQAPHSQSYPNLPQASGQISPVVANPAPCTSAPSCRSPYYNLSTTRCSDSEGAHPIGSSCYICEIDPSIKRLASCPKGWSQNITDGVGDWTATYYSCESACGARCGQDYYDNTNTATFRNDEALRSCIGRCPNPDTLANPCPSPLFFYRDRATPDFSCEIPPGRAYFAIAGGPCSQCGADASGQRTDTGETYCSSPR